MPKKPELCEHGKPYPCYNCKEPCVEELKRREFYDPMPEPWEDEEYYDEEDDEDLYQDDYEHDYFLEDGE